MVFDAPRRARAFFEALIADNLDIGRPANVEIIFRRHIQRDTTGMFKTAIDRPMIGPDSGEVMLNVFYKHSQIKQTSNTAGDHQGSDPPRRAQRRQPDRGQAKRQSHAYWKLNVQARALYVRASL